GGSRKTELKSLVPLSALAAVVLLVVTTLYLCRPPSHEITGWQPPPKAAILASKGISPVTLNREAADLTRDKHYDEAVAKLNQALRILRQHPNADLLRQTHEELAHAYDAHGQYDDAVREYRKVIDFFPDAAAAGRLCAAKNIGVIYLNRRKYDQ